MGSPDRKEKDKDSDSESSYLLEGYERHDESRPFARVVPVMRRAYPLARMGGSIVVAGNGRPASDPDTTPANEFGGWADEPRDTEGDDYIVITWLPRTKNTYIMVAFETIYIIILWSVMLLKIAGWSVRAFDMFFTNWSWTIQAIFFTADLLCLLDPTRRATYWLLLVWWWPMLITVVAVCILVQLVLFENSVLFTEAAKDYGIGQMVLGHELVHIVPVFIVMLFGITRGPEITASITMLRDSKGRYGVRLPVYVFVNYLYPILIVFAYVTVNDYLKVYHVKVNPAAAMGAILVLYTLLFAFCIWWVFPRDPDQLPDQNIRVVVLKHDVDVHSQKIIET